MYSSPLKSWLWVAIFFFLSTFSFAQDLFINELASSNSGVIEDPDFGETGDWIELYNNTNTSQDLSGYYLSDNLGDSTKWQFPVGTQIAANGFLLIWADGRDIALHTNFKLTKEGEEVGLYDLTGGLLDKIVFPAQGTDISYGRITDGDETWGFFPEPTPGDSNTTTAYEGITYYRVNFSEKGGFYNNPLTVELSSLGGDIRYTLDGSFPTESDPLYTGPISIDETTNLRASVFIPNHIPGKASTQTYFLNENFENRKLPVVSISTNPEYFWDADIGLYVQDFKPEWEYPINIELFENDGSDRAAFNELAGTKVNGLNSWVLPQKMLGIYFDNEYDQNNIEYPLFFDRRRNKFDTFILRAGGSDWSFTLFRDGLCQELAREAMDVETSGFRPSIVYVNGAYMGIHNMRSRIDEGFIEENFGLASDEYDLIENNGVVEQGDDLAFNELWSLLNQNLSIQSNYDAVADLMDITNFMDFFITEIYMSNGSWGHNLEMWKPKAPGSKWRWILADFDRGFSGSENNGIAYFSSDNQPSGYNWARVALNNMLDNDTFAAAFLSRFADHMFTTFHPDRIRQYIAKRQSAIEFEMPMHIDRWLGTTSSYGNAMASLEFWQNQVLLLHKYVDERHGYIFRDLINHFDVTNTSTLGVISTPQNGGKVMLHDQVISTGNRMGTYLQNLQFTLTATPEVGHQFEGWSSTALQTLIAKESVWKYLDNGTYPGNVWNTATFNDGSWDSGPAQLGYGDSDENTIVSFGNDSANKYITTYFRKTFTVENPEELSGQLLLNILRDDAAIVYINGEEVYRSNIPVGTLDQNTKAIDFVASPAESLFNLFSINVDQLLEGDNIIAVEVHQNAGNSSDLSFDLELKALLGNTGAITSIDPVLSTSLTDDLIMVAHFQSTGDCVLPDTIAQNTTLTIDCSPYLAKEDVLLLPGVTLTIDPGVEIHFPEEATLTIKGDLQVNGTADEPVRFLNNEDMGASTWGNLTFENATDTCHLNWLEMMNATYGDHPVQENAAIAAWKSVLVIDHLKIDDVAANPILGRYSDIWLTNSQLYSRVTGDLINVKYGYGYIDNCDFKGNNKIDTDAIDYDEVENGVIRNSKIYNFFGFNSDGVDLGEASSNVLLENNLIHNITDKGVSVGQASTVVSRNNTIVNCNQGFGVKDEGLVIIDKTTFYNNAYSVAAFEKNLGSGGGEIQISNSILSNSALASMLVDESSFVTVDHSLSDTDTIIGSDISFGNPVFDNPTGNLFPLQLNSPAINAGFDASGNPVDLGTASHLYTAKPSIQISAIQYHPVDSTETEFLAIYNPAAGAVVLDGYSFTEGFLFTFPADVLILPGETILLAKDTSLLSLGNSAQKFQWASGSLSNSGEQIMLLDAHSIIVDHVTYSDQSPWPEAADGTGPWISLISSDLDNHFAESWMLRDTIMIGNKSVVTKEIMVYPNPAKEVVYIQSEDLQIEKAALFNAVGRKIAESAYVFENLVTFDLQGLPTGVYFIRINGVHSKLILVQ